MVGSALRKNMSTASVYFYFLRDVLCDTVCVIFSFCLGWCSFSKMKAYLDECIRHVLYRAGFAKIKVYNGKKIHDKEEANRIIVEAIIRGKPFIFGRYGSVEIRAVRRVREDGKGFVAPISGALQIMLHSAGFFPKDKKLLIKFAQLIQWTTSQADMMGV